MKHRAKRIPAILLIVTLILGCASMVFAKKAQYRQNNRFAAKGEVVSISLDGDDLGEITLTLLQASRLLKNEVGLETNFIIAEDVKVKECGGEPGEFFPELLETVEAGDTVRVLGVKQADGTYLINKIVIY